jgi:hypothetical protein
MLSIFDQERNPFQKKKKETKPIKSGLKRGRPRINEPAEPKNTDQF